MKTSTENFNSTPSFATQGFVRKVAPIQTGFGFQERPFLRPQIPQMPMPMQRQNFSNRPRFQKFQNRGFRPHTQSGGTNFRGGFQHRNNDVHTYLLFRLIALLKEKI